MLAAQEPPVDEKARRAEQALAEERYPAAIALYLELVRSDPSNSGLLMNLGLAYHSAGDPDRAVDCFEAVLRLQPDFIPASLLAGLSYAKLGKFERAVEPLRRVVEADPSHREARFEFANACRLSGRHEEAAANFYKLVERDAGFARAWHGLGLSYLALSKAAQAKLPPAGLARLRSTEPPPDFRDARYWQLVAALKALSTPESFYWQARAYEELAKRAFAALEQVPPTGETHELMAEIRCAQGRHAEALEAWKEALELTPDSPELQRRLREELLHTRGSSPGKR